MSDQLFKHWEEDPASVVPRLILEGPVSQLLEKLNYKPERCEFDSQWCYWHNPSGLSLALWSTQFLTEMSTRNISWR